MYAHLLPGTGNRLSDTWQLTIYGRCHHSYRHLVVGTNTCVANVPIQAARSVRHQFAQLWHQHCRILCRRLANCTWSCILFGILAFHSIFVADSYCFGRILAHLWQTEESHPNRCHNQWHFTRPQTTTKPKDATHKLSPHQHCRYFRCVLVAAEPFQFIFGHLLVCPAGYAKYVGRICSVSYDWYEFGMLESAAIRMVKWEFS